MKIKEAMGLALQKLIKQDLNQSSLPRTRRSGKQPLEEGSRCRDGRGHVNTPRNLFSSDGQITVGGDDRRLENTRDSRRPPHQKDSPPLILTGRSTRTMDSLSDRLDGRVSKADLLAIIRE